MKIWLPDINVWVALAFDGHVNHRAAQTWFEGRGDDTCYFCRFTQQGFLRLATHAKVLGVNAVSMQEAWKLYDLSLSDSGVGFSVEASDLESSWRGLTQLLSYSPNTWSDAYLAAFAISGGLELITFDRGFGKFAGLAWTRLS